MYNGSTFGRNKKRIRLGQHFLASRGVAARIADVAGLARDESVFELGAGHGILTRELCKRAGRVVSVDVDKDLARSLEVSFAEFGNLQLACADGLAVCGTLEGGDAVGASCADDGSGNSGVNSDNPAMGGPFTILTSPCNVFASNLPYSHSRLAVEQLASSGFERCVVMVQREFASKLLAGLSDNHMCNERCRRAISVVAQHCFEISSVMSVPATDFEPRPSVDSVVLLMHRKNRLDNRQIETINKIFSYKRKQIPTILRMMHRCILLARDSCKDKSDSGGNNSRDNRLENSSDGNNTFAVSNAATPEELASLLSRAIGVRIDSLRLDDLDVSDVVRMADMLLHVDADSSCVIK